MLMVKKQDIPIPQLTSSLNLTYKGRLNFDIIDSILSIVALRLESVEKNINVRKRTYSVLMECAQNLCFHTNKSKEKFNYDPACIQLCLENNSDYYIITAGNYVRTENVPPFTSILENLVNMSHEELRVLYNLVLTNNQYSEKGGGGLGLIDIARKGKIEYAFSPVDKKNTYFTLTIKVFKEKAMKPLVIKSTPKTPEVCFDPLTGIFEITGMSCAEHALSFYTPIYTWLDTYVQKALPQTTLNFKLKYFNTSSAKCILQLLERVEKLRLNGKELEINWFFTPDDEQMITDGENYSSIIGIPFNMIEFNS